MKKFTLLMSLIFFPINSQSNDLIQEFTQKVKQMTLPNGLRVIVVERPESPAISFAMYLKTGGMDDESGKTGLAHMFEHMLFKGTKTIGTKNYSKETPLLVKRDLLEQDLTHANDEMKKAALLKKIEQVEKEMQSLLEEEEFWKIYERAGGTGLNASTGYDFTNYVISLPKNQLELWAAMESDRIRNPVLREFYKERAVVMEERRMRVDNSPDGKLWEAFLATAFMAHPYGRPIVGWESDISKVTRQDAEKFFKDHYGIDRLVVAIVGGVSADQVFTLIKNKFADIPAPQGRPRFNITVEPPQEGLRRVDVEYDAEPSFIMGFHRPDMHDKDDAAFSVLDQILSGGRTSRFHREIIEKKKLASSAWSSGSTPGERDPNLFVVGGSPRSPYTTRELEKAFWVEIKKIQSTPVSTEELERVRTRVGADLIRALESSDGMAKQLAYYEAVGGDWHLLFQMIEEINRVTAADIQRIAQTYLVPSNATIGTVVKKK